MGEDRERVGEVERPVERELAGHELRPGQRGGDTVTLADVEDRLHRITPEQVSRSHVAGEEAGQTTPATAEVEHPAHLQVAGGVNVVAPKDLVVEGAALGGQYGAGGSVPGLL